MIEARVWKPLENGRTLCRLCSHACVVEPGGRGRCGVRQNRDGRLFTLTYDRVAALNVDPVEKKPLYHFHPGTSTFSFGTQGCNLACTFCQNAGLSQPPRETGRVSGQPASPEMLVRAAQAAGTHSISYTYSEPTIFFELMQDTARLARTNGLKNIIVSNGFMSPACLDELSGLIDAANIDLKAFSEDFYREQCDARLAPVLDNLKRINGMGWWLEVTTLVIPGLNDSDAELAAIASFIASDLGPDTPWHVSRFHPQYRLTDRPPTPISTLDRAYRAGQAAGLRHVYVGNVPGHDSDATRCPECKAAVITRLGFGVTGKYLRPGGLCAACGHPIAGVGLS